MIKHKNIKKGYIITCASSFRDRIEVLCRKKKVNAGDIARSIILTIDSQFISSFPDSGEPALEDREFFYTKSDKNKKYPKKIKPRIQLRLPTGYDNIFIRKALNLALSLDKEETTILKALSLSHLEAPPASEPSPPPTTTMTVSSEQIEHLKSTIYALLFEPLQKEITTQAEAFYILGIPPFSNMTLAKLKQRFRFLATIHHPDNELGSKERMQQLKEAFDFLKAIYQK